MGSARRNARGAAKKLVGCGLSLVLATASSGCAALGFRGTDHSYLGYFWGTKSEEVYPGGDLYAQQMNEAKSRSESREAANSKLPSLESKDSKKDSKPESSKDDAKPDDPSLPPALEPRTDPSAPGLDRPEAGKSASTRRSDTNTVRVTLGRPEGLPTVAKAGPRPSQSPNMLASNAGSSKWTRDPAPREIAEESDPAEPDNRQQLASRSEPRAKRRPSATASEEMLSASRTPKAAPEDRTRELLTQAESRLKSLTTYQVAMTRVERVGGQLQPEENVTLSISQSPKAVHLKWEAGPSKGREVLYSTSIDDKVIHVNMANAAIPLPRMSIAVDSPLIMKNSRHSIKEAGFDTIISNMVKAMDTPSRGVSAVGRVHYEGLVQRQGIDRKCHRFVRNTPEGEEWEVLLDSESLMPRSVIAKDQRGELLERYTYRDLKENPVELASANAFDPDARWGKSRGLFSRLAGGAGSSNKSSGNDSQSTTR